MSRSLRIRKPTLAEIRQLEIVRETTADRQVQRRAEVLLLWAVGLAGIEIAEALQAHRNTVYHDLDAFQQRGLACLYPSPVGGTPARITPAQLEKIWRLAECAPGEFNLPYGRWSLANFREFLTKKQRVLKRISREHLRRLLKKRIFDSAAWSASSSVRILNGGPSYRQLK